MGQLVFFILLVSIIGVIFIFGLSFFKVESNVSTSHVRKNKDFNSFLTKIKSNSSKI